MRTTAFSDLAAEAVRAADALQAAYFRDLLTNHRAQLQVILAKVSAQVAASEEGR